MKTLLALLLLIPLNLYSELSEWENQTWKCSGQDLNGNGEINGFAECTHKQTNENFYQYGLFKEDIIINSFIISN